MEYITKNPAKTRSLAKVLIKKFLKYNTKKAIVIALEGELGAGKTVFVKGLARALRVKEKIKSPTFNLIKKYPIFLSGKSEILNPKFQSEGSCGGTSTGIAPETNSKFLYHLDCYRLHNHRDLKTLGIKETLNNPANIVVIEWSDRVKKILPKKYIKIHINHIDRNTRKITISD